MLLPMIGIRNTRVAIISYDVRCPKRSRRVRQALDPWRFTKQYSVYELNLTPADLRTLLTEVRDACDLSTDSLLTWQPADGMRLIWNHGRLMISARGGDNCWQTLPPRTALGNFVICYDISDPKTLRAVGNEVAAEAAMLQRSVYWLRASLSTLSALFARCAQRLAATDRLWAYPLRGHHDLSALSTTASSLLPIAHHHWSLA